METVRIAIDLPVGVLSALRKEPSDFVAEMRLAAVKWYEIGLLSHIRTVVEFGRWLGVSDGNSSDAG